MRLLVFLLFIFWQYTSFAQLKIDRAVKKEYKKLSQKIPNEQWKERKMQDPNTNSLIITGWVTDTLNKEDFMPHYEALGYAAPVEYVTAVPPPKEKRRAKRKKAHSQFWSQPCVSMYIADTLVIRAHDQKRSGPELTVKLIGSEAIGGYRDLIWPRTPVPPEFQIRVKAKVERLTLSKVPKRVGETFYGKATIVTDQFKWQSDYFKNGYRVSTLKVSFLFTSTLAE